MAYRCEPDALLQEACEFITFNRLSDLSAAQLSIVKQAGKAVMRDMSSKGLSEREYDVLMAYNDAVESATERYRLLKSQAKQIAHYRDAREVTLSDRQIIGLAAAAIAETTSEAGESLNEDSLDQDELDIITADHRLNSDEPLFPTHASGDPFSAATEMHSEPHHHHLDPHSSRPQPRAETVVSHTASVLESIDAITDFTNLSSLSISRIPAEKAAKLRSYMHAHPDKFKKPKPEPDLRQQNGRVPRLPELPQIPGYRDLDESLLPDTVADLDTEIEAALQDFAGLLEYLVRLDGMIWRMKMKRNVLNDARE